VIAYLNFTTVLCTQIHKQNQWKLLNLTQKKDEHNTKQIKYRRKLHLTLLSLSFFGPMVSYLIICILKNNTKQWNLTEGTANTSRGVYWAKVNQQLTLPRRYSQLAAVASLRVRNPRHRSSSETFLLGKFIREPNCSWTGEFVNRGSTLFDKFMLGVIKYGPAIFTDLTWTEWDVLLRTW
jgi:hypothetical protein